MKKNRQTANVMEIRGKKALLKVGIMPMLVDIKDVVMIKEKATVCTHQQQKKNHQIQNPKQMSGVYISLKHSANSNHEISLIMAYLRIQIPEQTVN